MPNLDQDESKPRRRWPTYAVIVLVLLLIAYPLSIGPAYVPLDWTGEPATLSGAYHVVYAPLYWICDATDANRWLGDYLQWWAAW